MSYQCLMNNFNMKHFYDPKRTTAKFLSYCKGCGIELKKGSPIVYDKNERAVYCPVCGNPIMRGLEAERSFDRYGTDIYV